MREVESTNSLEIRNKEDVTTVNIDDGSQKHILPGYKETKEV
jgi:hypothetical protein